MNQPDPTPSAALDAEIEAAVGSLTLDRAVRVLTGASMFALHGEPSIGLAPMVFSDGPTGVRGSEFAGGRPVTLLPNATLLASGWDEDSAELAGRLLADEALAQGVHVVLGPTINLHRTPLHGRLFEAYSEDPLLTGRLAAAYVRGLQGSSVGACPKHFLANEAETLRHTVDSRLGARALRELYLLAFQICVEDSHPWTIMAAYNDVNGVASTEHDELLNGVLKGEWGWDGLVMSDWFATKTAAASASGGLDLVMPGPDGPWGAALTAAVTRGEVPVAAVRDHLRRLLRLAGRVGAFGTPAGSTTSPPPSTVEPSDPARRAVLRTVAAAGMTVLTNVAETLPIDMGIPRADTPLLVVGRHAVYTLSQGGGSAKVRPQHEVSIAEGLESALPAGTVRVLDGVEVRQRCQPADPGFVRDPETGAPGIRVTSRRADGTVLASEAVGVAEAVVGIYSTRHAGASTVELAAALALTDRASVEVGVLGDGRWTLDIDGLSQLLPPRMGRTPS